MVHERAYRGGFDPRRLPEFAPDPALWSRICAAQVRRTTRRRWQRIALGGALVASFGAAVLVVGGRLMVAPGAPPATTAMQDESRALENEWRKLAGSRAAALGTTRLRAIDAELQAAYDRGGSAADLAPLWQQRNRALRELIAVMQDGALVHAGSITQI